MCIAQNIETKGGSCLHDHIRNFLVCRIALKPKYWVQSSVNNLIDCLLCTLRFVSSRSVHLLDSTRPDASTSGQHKGVPSNDTESGRQISKKIKTMSSSKFVAVGFYIHLWSLKKKKLERLSVHFLQISLSKNCNMLLNNK
ncbi:unnamed protein product [Heterobilharzia americana]|nr:unnamed protein product [Heterobilharzia americana]CAH8660587.1 unnamed protein product [Heterobilharzia americana]